MRIGVPKEIKDRELRVALTPDGVAALRAAGHQVVIEHDAGSGSGYPDAAYRAAGATLADAAAAWAADLVVKVKEPLPSEYHFLAGQYLFTYLHLAGVTPALTDALLTARTTAIAYETVEAADGTLPLLAPMSAIAGNIAVLAGAHYLATAQGGRGTLPGRVFEQSFGSVLVIGDGVVGRHAARSACALGARTTIASRHAARAGQLRAAIDPRLRHVVSTPEALAEELPSSDLVIGAVLLRGAKAPWVVTEAMVRTMQPGAVIVDVSIDQGGCIATSRPTTHSDPVYRLHEVTHYCVTNMPGAYPRTATQALTAATLPYVRALADDPQAALREPGLAKGINTHAGWIGCEAVAAALDRRERWRPYSPA